jgi:hypothetical protein
MDTNYTTTSKELQMSLTKIKNVDGRSLGWSPAEWSDEAQAAYVLGYELVVELEGDGRWSWMTKVTSEISETPELIDCGYAKSESGAKNAAGVAVNKSVRRRRQAEAEVRLAGEAQRREARRLVAERKRAERAAAKAAKAQAAAVVQEMLTVPALETTRSGRGPSGNLRQFARMGTPKLQETLATLQAEANDPEAVEAASQALAAR